MPLTPSAFLSRDFLSRIFPCSHLSATYVCVWRGLFVFISKGALQVGLWIREARNGKGTWGPGHGEAEQKLMWVRTKTIELEPV